MLLGSIFAASVFAVSAFAQTSPPQIWITWRAVTYLPDNYQGRALPVPGATVIAAVDMMEGGRPANLSGQTTYWYLNDQVLQTGMGLTRIKFTVPSGTTGGAIALKITMPDYKDGITKTIRIPVSSPEAVVQEVPGNRIQSRSFTLHALPYYFNVADPALLDVKWSVRGSAIPSSGNPFELTVSLDQEVEAGTRLPVHLRIENPDGSFEFTNQDINLLFSP